MWERKAAVACARGTALCAYPFSTSLWGRREVFFFTSLPSLPWDGAEERCEREEGERGVERVRKRCEGEERGKGESERGERARARGEVSGVVRGGRVE